MYRKEIVYDREARDYAMCLDGGLVGFARTYHEAEVTLDQLVFELMSGEFFKAPDGLVVPPVDEPQPITDESNACAGFGCVDGCGDCESVTTTTPSFYTLIVAECQAELDARLAEPVVMVPDVDLGGPGGIDLYAAAFEIDDQPDLIAEAGILINTLEEMQFDLCADYEAEGRFPPAVMAYHNRLCRILAKAERRLQRRETAELGGVDFTPPDVEYAPFGFVA